MPAAPEPALTGAVVGPGRASAGQRIERWASGGGLGGAA